MRKINERTGKLCNTTYGTTSTTVGNFPAEAFTFKKADNKPDEFTMSVEEPTQD